LLPAQKSVWAVVTTTKMTVKKLEIRILEEM
jgi:hypothetical protein